MKKLITTILAIIMLIWVFPVSAHAEETISAPKTVQYKLINHDKVALRWSKVEGADKYYIYKRNDETGKYVKKYEVKSNACTLNNLSAETEYSYAVIAVKELNGKQIKSKSSNKVCFCTPSEWVYYYNQERVDGGYISNLYVSHYDKSNSKIFNDVISSTYASMIDFDSEYITASEGIGVIESTLFYYENYVYYICREIKEVTSPQAISYYLCRMKNDGTNLEVLYCLAKDNFDINIGRLTVNNGYIYISMNESYYDLDEEYIYSFQDYIYKVSIDGKEQTKN